MAEFIARWFTPSKATGVSGEKYNAEYNAQQQAANAVAKREVERSGPAEKSRAKKIKPPTKTQYGGADLLGDQATVAKKQLLGQ